MNKDGIESWYEFIGGELFINGEIVDEYEAFSILSHSIKLYPSGFTFELPKYYKIFKGKSLLISH